MLEGRNKFESGVESKFEKEKEAVATFEVDIARHSVKGANAADDTHTPLSVAGMEAAAKKGSGKQTGEFYGSPRERTVQSSLLRALGDKFQEVDFSNTDPQELVKWFEEGGADITKTPLLDFNLGEGEYKAEVMVDFKAGKLLKWFTEQSDKRAVETKQDPEFTSTLSTQAENIAMFIFAKLAEKYSGKKDKEKGMDFATSHQSVLESFLYKVIKMKDGDEEAKKFVENLNDQGFKENEGFKIIGKVFDLDDTSDCSVEIQYKDKSWNLSLKELSQIINEGEELRNTLKATRKE